jgi:hypothetical protein
LTDSETINIEGTRKCDGGVDFLETICIGTSSFEVGVTSVIKRVYGADVRFIGDADLQLGEKLTRISVRRKTQ